MQFEATDAGKFDVFFQKDIMRALTEAQARDFPTAGDVLAFLAGVFRLIIHTTDKERVNP